MIFPGLIIACDGDGISWTISIRIMTKVMVNLVNTYQDDAGDGLLQITFLSLIELNSQFYLLLLAKGCPRGGRLIHSISSASVFTILICNHFTVEQ